MERERRIDRILLRQAMLSKPSLERKYWLAERLYFFRPDLDQNKLLSLKNSDIILLIVAYPLRIIIRHFRKQIGISHGANQK